MATVDELIKPLLHSPQLPLLVDRLAQQLSDERLARQQFYEEMTPDQKIEFIDGEVILHSPARNRHLDVTMLTVKLLHTFVGIHCLGTVKSEKCLCVFPRNDYEPDVVFFGPDKAAKLTPDTMKFPAPDLAVEVLSSSTEDRDRGVKFEDFAINGVGEYWVVDAVTQTIEQYVLKDARYELRVKSSSGRLRSVVIAGLEFEIEAMFDEQKNLDALRKIMA
ncbi:MAG: Uma2 family endonuclease [Planctomycetota bacterium]|nr:Uma2 family endonuclease [Planctomycetota bacterium]